MSKGTRKRAGRNSDAGGNGGDDATSVDDAGNGGSVDASSGGSESIVIPGPEPIEPDAAVGDTTEQLAAEPRRKRGRPPGSGSTTSKTRPIPLNVTGLEKLLVGIHGGLAIMSGRSEWSLDTENKLFDGKTEAEFLAQSSADVARHYGGIADQKTLDWMNLIQCLAIVYGTRIYAIKSSPKAPRVVSPPLAQRTASPSPQHHRTPPPVNEFNGATPPESVGNVPGIGDVQFPPDHPLAPKMKLN